MEMTNTDKELLEKLKVDIISANRNYWLVRTNAGMYFDDFYMEGYIGIEWDKIIPEKSNKSLEDLKEIVHAEYPNEERQGYIANQIYKFVSIFKKGDIIIIPNKDSKFFAFGELMDDNIVVEEELPSEFLTFEEDQKDESQFLRKRRKVRWLKTFRRTQLDPYLKTFIYAHNTIVDLSGYSDYIDRMLSDFYIKDDIAYYTLRVQKETNIPMDHMLDLMLFNRDIVSLINILLPDYHIDKGEIISKIDIQSKGPFQLTGPIKKILLLGCATTLIVGGTIKLDAAGNFEITNNGLVGLINSLVNAYDVYQTHKENQTEIELDDLRNDYEKLKSDLQLSVPPTVSGNELIISLTPTSTVPEP